MGTSMPDMVKLHCPQQLLEIMLRRSFDCQGVNTGVQPPLSQLNTEQKPWSCLEPLAEDVSIPEAAQQPDQAHQAPKPNVAFELFSLG